MVIEGRVSFSQCLPALTSIYFSNLSLVSFLDICIFKKKKSLSPMTFLCFGFFVWLVGFVVLFFFLRQGPTV